MVQPLRRIKSLATLVLRYRNYGGEKTPVFVLGCHRSGTTMVLDIVARSPKVHSYHEGDGVVLEKNYFRLISDDTVRKAIARTPEPIMLFKPLNDSQHADRLLQIHPRAKAIWLYRHYEDVVSSALKKWNDLHRTMIREVSSGHFSNPGREAIGDRVSLENLRIIREFAQRNLSPEDGAALLWYLRNSIYFDLGLQKNPNVLLCKYEDLVLKPTAAFNRLFSFLGLDFSPIYVEEVHSGSVKKKDVKGINSDIAHLCENMMARLDGHYKEHSSV